LPPSCTTNCGGGNGGGNNGGGANEDPNPLGLPPTPEADSGNTTTPYLDTYPDCMSCIVPTVDTNPSSGPNWLAIIGTTALVVGGVLLLATGVGVMAYGGLMVYAGVTEIFVEGAVGLVAIEAFQGIIFGVSFVIPSGFAGLWVGGETLQAATTYSH